MESDTVASGFAAMGSTARLDVLRILVRAGDNGLKVGEIQERSGIAPSTLAHHLRILTEAGVTEQAREGRTTVTKANYDHLRMLAAFVLTECCADIAEEENQMSDLTQNTPRSAWDLIRAVRSPWTITLLVPVLVAVLDPDRLGEVVSFGASAFVGTLPYIAFAVLLIAWLKAAGAESVVAEAFKGRETRMIVLAALLGGLAPFCSCEVIPFIAGLLALGAPLSAVMAFWLSSPLIDPPTLLITAAALGWPFAVGKAIAAVGLGLLGGFAIKLLTSTGRLGEVLKPQTAKGCGCGPSPLDGKPVWAVWKEDTRRASFRAEFLHNAAFLIKWLALAYALEALLVTYVPAELIARVVGGEGLGPIVLSAFVGMPAYLNSYVAPALLAGLTEQGMSAGAAMAFMVAGAISSIPAMAAVYSLVQRKVFALYIGLGLTGAILSGVLFQMVY